MAEGSPRLLLPWCVAQVAAVVRCSSQWRAQAEAAEAKLSLLLSMEQSETHPSGFLAGIVSWSVRQVCAGWTLLCYFGHLDTEAAHVPNSAIRRCAGLLGALGPDAAESGLDLRMMLADMAVRGFAMVTCTCIIWRFA